VFGNAHFLSWFWHYSNAVGGVTVHVRNRDAEKTRKVLTTARAKPSVSLPPWICSSCGQRVGGRWDACWQCGHLADGTLVSSPAEDIAAQPEGDAEAGIWHSLSRIFAVAAGVLLVILLFKHGWKPPLILAPLVAILFFLLRQFEPSSGRESQPQESTEPSEPPSHNLSTTRSELSKVIVRRAWQAAVIAAFSFPPLGSLPNNRNENGIQRFAATEQVFTCPLPTRSSRLSHRLSHVYPKACGRVDHAR
jgi:hypothetical protein